jgi:plastocyanin
LIASVNEWIGPIRSLGELNMPHTTVNILSVGFSPDPVMIEAGNAIQWINSTTQVQDATGETFTTGPIQPGAASLPIAFDFADPGLSYTSTTGLHGTIVVSEAAPVEEVVQWPQVRALFTDQDVAHMLPFDLDLTSKDEVCGRAAEILDRVTRTGPGRMPPPPLPKWSTDQVDLLRKWKEQGCPD